MKIRNFKDFVKLKRKYTGLFVNVEVKEGNGSSVSGVIAPAEIELELMGYLGLLKKDGDFLFVIKEDNSCTYLCSSVINKITVDTSKRVAW